MKAKIDRFLKKSPMSPVAIRLPDEARKQAKELACKNSNPMHRVTETDIYRAAILSFLAENSTDSREQAC